MTAFEDLPSINASQERLADWVEFLALTSTSGGVSRNELVKSLVISGNDDTTDEPEEDQEEEKSPDTTLEAIADGVFSELDDRMFACGGDQGAFPYSLSENYVELRASSETAPYRFMVALASRSRENDTLFKRGVKLFEALSAEAAKQYIGGALVASESLVFGFPRDDMPAGFADAVTELCKRLGEGLGPNRNRKKLKDEKDAGLDIVAWTSFLDARAGKLIAFGQCAAGKNWGSKITELANPYDWWTNWIEDRPGALPIKMFFVPHRVPNREWFNVCANAGILFDRCRIAHLAAKAPSMLLKACEEWAEQALRELRKA